MSDMKTCAQCGGALLYGANGYGGKICQCNLNIFQVSAEQDKRIAELHELGKSYARIADEKTKQNKELVEALETVIDVCYRYKVHSAKDCLLISQASDLLDKVKGE